MQCWKVLDDKSKPVNDSASIEINLKSKTFDDTNVIREKWNFSVLYTHKLSNNEFIAVSGEDELGNWNPQNGLILKPNEDKTIWTNSIDIITDKEIQYRYFVCAINESSQSKIIRKWETHLKTRTIPILSERNDFRNQSNDTFGDIDGEIKIDRGWLTNESIIEFKFMDYPVFLKKNIKNRLFLKMTAISLNIHSAADDLVLEDSLSNESTSENEIDKNVFIEVVSLKNTNCTFSEQSQFGEQFNKDDFLIFHVTLPQPENVAFLIDFYIYNSSDDNEPPYHLGYQFILPTQLNLKKSDGHLQIPITCATKHRPIGTIDFDYTKITPLNPSMFDMRISYIRYWNQKWTGLDVGHRGSGSSFKNDCCVKIRENTIASFKEAAHNGADMIEFDVQLSKDLVPIIYHDFEVCVSLKRKKIFEDNDMFELSLKDLTLDQLKNLKVYHVVEGRCGEATFFDEDLDEHQPCPQLADALDLIESHVGFNVEIKWPMKRKDGSMEHSQFVDRNIFIDCILNVLLPKAKNRRIVFSCFDPEICTMLRYKQNIYPVMFLTQGVTKKYPSYFDVRCNSIEGAVKHALAMELLGIVAHTEDLLRDSSQINMVTDRGLIIFCWGDDNNCTDIIKHLKSLGLHAIIYDKMRILSPKEIKKSIFLLAGKNTERDFFELRHIEQETEVIHENKNDFEKTLNLRDTREKLSLSTSTSTDSI